MSNLFTDRSGEVIVMTARSDVDDHDISLQYWIPASIASGFMVIWSLVHAIMYLDGYLQSCRQYRNELIKYMHATMQSRLSCTAVFDFMDDLHPDVLNVVVTIASILRGASTWGGPISPEN